MKLSPFAVLFLTLVAVDISLTAVLSIVQPEAAIIRGTLNNIELTALVLTMTVAVWRIFRSF